MRSISRVVDVSINTVAKLLAEGGEACTAFHDEKVRGVKAKRVQCDEIWAFCYSRQRNVATAKAAPEETGDIWTWTALDADTKLIVSYLVGDRDAGYAATFMDDVAARLASRVQLTTDGLKAYLDAVEGAFGADVDCAQLVKLHGDVPESPTGRYSPAECTCVAQDTFYVGTLKGVGRIYQQTAIDTYSKVAFAKLYDTKTPITAADLLNDRVLPFFDEQGIAVSRVLTDRGTEYCGNPETHDYELYLAVEDIDHTRTKARSPHTNGICERFHRTVLEEFYRVAFRKKVDRGIEALQADLDAWMRDYNILRTHQGRWCYGKTPMQTFIDSIPIAKEKLHIAA